MKVLHITPHLGGGVGKAHATLAEAARAGRRDSSDIQRSYVLLEPPRDAAYAERVRAAGCELHLAPDPARLGALAAAADVVQIEWWSHPRLYGLLASGVLPAMRLVLWTHISGLATPMIPLGLARSADHVVFTAPCSLDAPNLRAEIRARPGAFAVANSGFGFEGVVRPKRAPNAPLRCGYVGTLDFVKLHPEIFDFLDALAMDVRLSLWGRHDPRGPVAERARQMRSPDRVRFEGYAADPVRVFAELDLFIYLLRPGHYGTGENALIEAMSAGAVPIVWDNPAEAGIVSHGRTGLVVSSKEAFADSVAALLGAPGRLEEMRSAMQAEVGRRFSPAESLRVLARTYRTVMDQPKRNRCFGDVLGRDARAWFATTLSDQPDKDATGRLASETASKGSLAHFLACYPDDASLHSLKPEG